MRFFLMLGAVTLIGMTAACQKGGETTQQAAPPAQQMQPAPAPTQDTGMKADTTKKDTSAMSGAMKPDTMKKDTGSI